MMANTIPSSMHTLQYLLEGLAEHLPSQEIPVEGLAIDNRRTRPGDLFCACAGTHTHGLLYAKAALDAGAIAIAYEDGDCLAEHPAVMQALTALQTTGVLLIPVSELRSKLGIIASRFYARPSSQQFVIGITGTNGKTSCAQFIAEALSGQAPCGVLGTLGNGVYGQLQSSATTTPDAISLQHQLADLCEQGIRNVVMEVSSHGLVQGRANGVDFNVAVFTNLSRDHLDYHESMEGYAQAKRMLFDVPGLDYAVINIDDEYGRQLLQEVPGTVQVLCYGLSDTLDKFESQLRHPLLLGCVTARHLQLEATGMQMQVTTPWGEAELHSALLGRFNASNLLAALSVLLLRGYPVRDATAMLAGVHTVPGRMQALDGETGQPRVVIDYAHTPDALRAVLSALREHTPGKLICVFGCGGDRDRGKRPLMGAEAEQLADRVILTDDNPRSEQPAAIISDICEGMQHPGQVHIEHDRGKAICDALASATAQDIVLVAGKGHEDYQIIGEQRLPFSDAAVIKAWLVEHQS
jgi:UDP-N-acetylmuramoyl-L-alanyl-D-glutamate--2,6-diaminopimelate ligase